MKISNIMFAVWIAYGRAREHNAINWRCYVGGGGPARYIGQGVKGEKVSRG